MLAGVRRRVERERKERVVLAWDTAAMSRAAKLRPLDEYLEDLRPKPKRSILAKLRDAVAQGAPMTISRMERN